MSKYINEDTRVTLDLKTIGMVLVGAASLISLYFSLQSDIEEAKGLPKPEVTGTEYHMKDEYVRESIQLTQEDIKEIKEDLKVITDRLYEIKSK